MKSLNKIKLKIINNNKKLKKKYNGNSVTQKNNDEFFIYNENLELEIIFIPFNLFLFYYLIFLFF
mgnify:CR=1 FL=1|jgi:hypothetical protein